MANITKAINMSFRVDKKLKEQADILFRNLGMNTSVALNMFLTQCVREQQLPFTPTMNKKMPTRRLKKALDELEMVESGKIELPEYHTMEDLINALNDD